MESTEVYQAKLKTLQEAIQGFAHSLEIDLETLDEEMQDLVRNGQVQKFEYCTELLWKVMKLFLSTHEGVDEASPKAVIKAFYRTQKISTELYESLITIIYHRNLFSHIYNEDQFEQLYGELKTHAKKMQEVLQYLVNMK